MKFQRIKCEGEFWVQEYNGIPPTVVPEDEGRIIYNTIDKRLYYCDGVKWEVVGKGADAIGINYGLVQVNRNEFIATNGQTMFYLDFGITSDKTTLMVFRDNILLQNNQFQVHPPNVISLNEECNNGEEITVIAIASNVSINRFEAVATENQTLFELPFTYTIGKNNLLVFSNNILMILGRDYIEVPIVSGSELSNKILFLEGRNEGEVITIIHLGVAGEPNDGVNIGSEGIGIYAGKEGYSLKFRKIHLDPDSPLTAEIVNDEGFTIKADIKKLPELPNGIFNLNRDRVLITRETDDGQVFYKVPVNKFNLETGSFYFPIGTILPYSGSIDNIPDFCLLCDGSLYNIADYPQLYGVVGRQYSLQSDPSDKFRVPDLRCRTIIGTDQITPSNRIIPNIVPNRSSDTWTRDAGGTGGADQHQLTVAELPEHRHQYFNARGGSLWGYAGGGHTWGMFVGATHDTTDTGGNMAHNNIQPSMAMHYIIVAKFDANRSSEYGLAKAWCLGWTSGVIETAYNVQSVAGQTPITVVFENPIRTPYTFIARLQMPWNLVEALNSYYMYSDRLVLYFGFMYRRDRDDVRYRNLDAIHHVPLFLVVYGNEYV